MWLLVVILVLLLTMYYLRWNKHRKKYAKFYNLPGPRAYPFIGHGYLFLGKQMFKVFEDLLKNVGFPYLLYLPDPYYCTSDPEEIKTLLNHPNVMSKSENYNFFQVVFGNGLIFTPADIWRPKRKLLSRAFNKALLDSFVPIFYKNCCSLKECLLKNDDLYGSFQTFNLTSFLETAGGISVEGLTKKLVHMITIGQEIVMNRTTSPTMRYDFFYKLSKGGRLVSSYITDVFTIIRDILKKKTLSDQELIDPLARFPLIELLLKLKNEGKYNEEQVLQEIATFAAAGTDTSGYTLSFVCTLLGMHPHIQEKVFEEVMTVIGPIKEIETTDLPNLKYTEMVILETLRILPTVPIIGRQTDADIDIGRCVIPSGSNIMIGIFDLHRNEKYYPNPTEFNPNRFSPEEMKNRDPNAFVPFSTGPRNCIGWLYALMLMKTVIASIVRDCKISSKHKSVTEFGLESNLTIKIVPAPDCRFTRR